MHLSRSSWRRPSGTYTRRRCIANASVCRSWRLEVSGLLESRAVSEERARVLVRPRRLRTVASARRFERHEGQQELTPRIGRREPLLRPEDAAELLSVKVSWIYEA